MRLTCLHEGRTLFSQSSGKDVADAEAGEFVSGPIASFRLSSGRDLMLTVELHQEAGSRLAADIAFRFLQRLALATAGRLERLLAEERAGVDADLFETQPVAEPEPLGQTAAVEAPALDRKAAGAPTRDGFAWLRAALGWEPPAAVAPRPSLGEE
jgi:UDP-GlcNAc:undecaprenyl-phosphate GlcNAc-1-phosphate transferase